MNAWELSPVHIGSSARGDDWEFRYAVRDAWDRFVDKFTIHPGRLIQVSPTEFVMTAIGFDLHFTVKHPVEPGRVTKANKTLTGGAGIIMSRPSF